MRKKVRSIFLSLLPIPALIALIPLVENDYALSLIYALCIVALLFVRKEKLDGVVLLLGITCLTVSEYIFVATGVETFTRRTLFDVMPLWLPLLWGYAFVTMKRVIVILTARA